MKTTLMTPEELTQRIANGEDHLELSIEKHKRARLKKNWVELCEGGHFTSHSCGLCNKHIDFGRADFCGECPIKSAKNSCSVNWRWANNAIGSKDRPAFMRHSRALIQEMESFLPKQRAAR